MIPKTDNEAGNDAEVGGSVVRAFGSDADVGRPEAGEREVERSDCTEITSHARVGEDVHQVCLHHGRERPEPRREQDDASGDVDQRVREGETHYPDHADRERYRPD